MVMVHGSSWQPARGEGRDEVRKHVCERTLDGVNGWWQNCSPELRPEVEQGSSHAASGDRDEIWTGGEWS